MVAKDVELLHSADLLNMACDDIMDYNKDGEMNQNGSEQTGNSLIHASVADKPVALSTSLKESRYTSGKRQNHLNNNLTV